MEIQVTQAMRRLARSIVPHWHDGAVITAVDLSTEAVEILFDHADENQVVTLVGRNLETIPLSLRESAGNVSIPAPLPKTCPWGVNTLNLPQWHFTPKMDTTDRVYKIMLHLGIAEASEAVCRSLKIVQDAFSLARENTFTVRGESGDTSLSFAGSSLMKIGVLYLYADSPDAPHTRHRFPPKGGESWAFPPLQKQRGRKVRSLHFGSSA